MANSLLYKTIKFGVSAAFNFVSILEQLTSLEFIWLDIDVRIIKDVEPVILEIGQSKSKVHRRVEVAHLYVFFVNLLFRKDTRGSLELGIPQLVNLVSFQSELLTYDGNTN